MNLAHLQQDSDPNRRLLNEIELAEATHLNTIFARFCLINGIKIDISNIEYLEFPDKPNYWEYWFSGRIKGKSVLTILLSRNLFMGDDGPVLEIKDWKEIAEDEATAKVAYEKKWRISKPDTE